MSEEATLFSHNTNKEIDQLKFTTTKEVVFRNWIEIDEHTFEAEDLYNTLQEAKNGGIYIDDRKMAAALKSIHVLDYEGHREGFPARVGPNFDTFMVWLKDKREKARPSPVEMIYQNKLLAAASVMKEEIVSLIELFYAWKRKKIGASYTADGAILGIRHAIDKVERFPCNGHFWYVDNKKYKKIPVIVIGERKQEYHIEPIEDIECNVLSLKKGNLAWIKKDRIYFNHDRVTVS